MTHAERAKKIADLRAQIRKVAAERLKLTATGHLPKAAEASKKLLDLQKQLRELRRTKPSNRKRILAVGTVKDPHHGVKITAANVGTLVRFYRQAVKIKVSKALADHYAARLVEAEAVLKKLPVRHRRGALLPKPGDLRPGGKPPMRRMPGKPGEAAIEEAAESVEAETPGEAADVPLPGRPPRGQKRRRPDLRVVDKPVMEAEAVESVVTEAPDEAAEMEKPGAAEVAVDQPWYRKPWLWIAGAVVAAVLFTQREKLFQRSSGSSGGKAVKGGSGHAGMPTSRLRVTFPQARRSA
jgi:hypothetical protein